MSLTFKKTKILLFAYKEGIIIGALAGVVGAYIAVSQGYTTLSSVAIAGKGLIDTTFGRSMSVTQLGTYKLYGTFAIIGAMVGFYSDMLIHSILKKRR